MPPAQFRELFEQAYPDAARFLGRIKQVDPKGRMFHLPFSIVVDGSVSSSKCYKAVLADIIADAVSGYTSGQLEVAFRDDTYKVKVVY